MRPDPALQKAIAAVTAARRVVVPSAFKRDVEAAVTAELARHLPTERAIEVSRTVIRAYRRVLRAERTAGAQAARFRMRAEVKAMFQELFPETHTPRQFTQQWQPAIVRILMRRTGQPVTAAEEVIELMCGVVALATEVARDAGLRAGRRGRRIDNRRTRTRTDEDDDCNSE